MAQPQIRVMTGTLRHSSVFASTNPYAAERML